MEKKQPNKPKGFRFNFYWIYGIIAIIFFGIQLMSANNSSKEISWREFNTEMLQKNDVEKVVIITNKKIAQIYIKEEALSKDKHKSISQKAIGNGVNKGPHYFIGIGDVGVFEEKLEAAQKDFQEKNKVNFIHTQQKDILGDALGWIFPLVIMIAIWMFFMRRMSGGVGPRGQIFNIGKSKATLFDKTKVM